MSVSVGYGSRLIDVHLGSVLRAPASNEKLLLSMALLERLGVGYRIPTTVEGPRPRHGVINGDLLLVGHGDPELNDAALVRLARKLRDRGIRAVQGGVVGVTNTFARERWAPGWHPIALQFIGLPTALTFDANSGPTDYIFDPERRAAVALTADLRALGIRVNERPSARRVPVARRHVLVSIRSAPLINLLRRQNLESLNLDAEVLTELLGAFVFGRPGSIAKGARAIEQWAQRNGVELVARDGSGLSYEDRVSSDGLARLLSVAAHIRWGAALRSTLPAGGRGTLAGRLSDVRVRAKTGTLLQRVSALSGYVWLRRLRRWAAFSILSGGLSKAQAVELEDRVVSIIAAKA